MMPPQGVELLAREAAFEGYFRVDRYRLRYEQFAGGMGEPVVREVFERGQVAAVLPLDPDSERVVLVEQFRAGAWACGWQPWLLECVAGIIEPGESAAEVARRETREESGCRITELVPICAPFLSSPGACTETVSLFCGRVDASAAGGIHGLDHEGEDIRVTTWSIDEALALLDSGRIVNAKTIIALQWLALNRERVLCRWRSDRP
jgi:ADP-ribose pyrophosphatase